MPRNYRATTWSCVLLGWACLAPAAAAAADIDATLPAAPDMTGMETDKAHADNAHMLIPVSNLAAISFVPAATAAAGSQAAEPAASQQQQQQQQMPASLPAEHLMRVLVVLKSKDAVGLDERARAVTDPSSSLYQQFMTTKQFARAFGATDKAIKTVRQYLTSKDLEVQSQANKLSLTVTGSADQINKAFSTTLVVSSGAGGAVGGRMQYAPVTYPSLPADIAAHIAAVLGLDNVPAANAQHALPLDEASDSGGAGSQHRTRSLLHVAKNNAYYLTVARLRTLYDLPADAFDGKGQRVAVATYQQYDQFDVEEFAAANSLPAPKLEDVFTGEAEASDPTPTLINLQMLLAAASKAYIYVYLGGNTEEGEAYMLEQIANEYAEKKTSVVLYTWTREERPNDTSSHVNTIFKQMAIQGQTVIVASGDCGFRPQQRVGVCIKGTTGVGFPQNLEYVMGVGGTTPTLYLSDNWASEVAWQLSGGGASKVVPIPNYQRGVARLASEMHRNVPDVALAATPDVWPYEVWLPELNFTAIGGTAAAASVWAGFAVLVNQCRKQQKLLPLGLFNSHLYSIGTSYQQWMQAFHDVTAGSNGAYSAALGYDPVTGWGTIQGRKLTALLCPGFSGACCYNSTPWLTQCVEARTNLTCTGTFEPGKSCSQASCRSAEGSQEQGICLMQGQQCLSTCPTVPTPKVTTGAKQSAVVAGCCCPGLACKPNPLVTSYVAAQQPLQCVP